MEIRQYFKILRKHWWAILLICAISGAYSFYLSLQQRPIYRATATIAINPQSPNPLISFSAQDSAQGLVPTYAEVIKGDAFAGLIVAALKLPDVNEDIVRAAVSVEGVPNTVLFRINAVSDRPDYAQ